MSSLLKDAELTQAATQSAHERWGKEQSKWDVVKFSMLVNAHAHGFWMGARHAAKRAKGRRSGVLRLFSRRAGGAADAPLAAEYYIKKTYPGISRDDRALVTGAFEAAFPLGYHYGEKRGPDQG